MKILLTGASGFFGKICYPILGKHHQIISMGRQANNEIIVDLANDIPQLPPIEVVLHAAGKAHVYPRTAEEKQAFFDINVTGTQHLLAALSKEVSAFVFISSVSVYGLGEGEEIDEETPLKGNSPYAASKIEAERLIQNWCKQHNVDYLILRLPLIAGKSPLGNLGKMLKAIRTKRYVRIARGEAKKSMVLASDVANLILNWVEQENRCSGIYNLTDGHHPSFYQLEQGLMLLYGIKHIPSIPKWLGTLLGNLGDSFSWFPINTGTLKKITCTFTFSDTRARKDLAWSPRSVIEHLNELL